MTRPGVTLAVTPSPDTVARLVEHAVASRIAGGDTSVWPGAARPGWVGAARAARPLVGEIEALRERLRVAGLHRVVLASAGGVGVAAEVLATGSDTAGSDTAGSDTAGSDTAGSDTAGSGGAGTGAAGRLVVLDTTDPGQVADALAGDLDATVLVVSVPPGEDTGAVRLLRATLDRAFRAEGLDPDRHTVVVAAPGSPTLADAGRATVVLGPSDVDGPWAALTAYALVPAGLAGADVAALLADATAAGPVLAADEPGNPALALGTLLAGAPVVALPQRGSVPVGGTGAVEWVAQLLAGGLGKDGRGPLPVVVEGSDVPDWSAPGALTVGPAGEAADVVVHGGPAAQLLLWEHATAVAAHLLGIDPTDRPDAAPGLRVGAAVPPAFVDGAVAVHAAPWLPAGTDTVADALRALLESANSGTGDGMDRGTGATGGATVRHVAVHAYLDRLEDASVAVVRLELSRRTGLVTTFGWAPRCLPGAGQRDKGGPAGGMVCQLTGSPDRDDDDPDDDAHDRTTNASAGDPLAQFQQAQARADGAELTRRGRPVLHLHLTDRVVGLVTLVRAVQEL